MGQEQTVFSQILQFVSYDDFYVCVRRYDGNKGIRRVLVLGTVFGDDICSADASGEPAGYRGVSGGTPEGSLSSGVSVVGQTLDVG